MGSWEQEYAAAHELNDIHEAVISSLAEKVSALTQELVAIKSKPVLVELSLLRELRRALAKWMITPNQEMTDLVQQALDALDASSEVERAG